jgi:hypothetical protein
MDLSLPEGEDWDASGEKNDLVKCFLILNVILFFGGGHIGEFLMDVSFHHEYRGETCLAKILALGVARMLR